MGWLARLLFQLFGRRPIPAPDPPPTLPASEIIARELAEHNHLRAARGIYLYHNSPALNAIAQAHADWMARHDDLDHFEPGADPYQRIRAAGYPVGSENIAWNYQTPESVSVGWTGDAGHRANVLSRQWTEVGFGMAKNAKGEAYWCADYGARAVPAGFQAAPLPGGIRGPGLTNP